VDRRLGGSFRFLSDNSTLGRSVRHVEFKRTQIPTPVAAARASIAGTGRVLATTFSHFNVAVSFQAALQTQAAAFDQRGHGRNLSAQRAVGGRTGRRRADAFQGDPEAGWFAWDAGTM
jgi:hypothetical protein